MSFGALSAQAKEALGRGASEVGTSTTTGDGGMTPEERGTRQTLVYQVLPSRYGMNPDDLRRADAIEVVVGQGAKPGGGGMLLGQKISERVAAMRDLPVGIDQRSACRHPDWTGPDDLEIKIKELREITDWEKPIYVKVGATRAYFDAALAVKAGADVIVLDGMQGGTAATQDVFIEHVGIPILAAIPPAVERAAGARHAPQGRADRLGRDPQGADAAKALALGADAVSIGVAAMIALGDNAPELERRVRGDRQRRRLLRRLARGPRPGRDLDPGPRARRAARPRARRAPARELPAHDDARAADARPRLRQVARPQPRARGPRRADRRGRGDGARAAGRHELDPGRRGLSRRNRVTRCRRACPACERSAGRRRAALADRRSPLRRHRERAARGAAVLVEDGRIAAIGAAGDGVPEGASVVELGGRTLMPGLIDAHAHV